MFLDLVLENIVNAGHLPLEARDKIKEALLRRHRHQHERKHDKVDRGSRLPLIRSLADIGRNSSKSMFGSSSKFYFFFTFSLLLLTIYVAILYINAIFISEFVFYYLHYKLFSFVSFI